jgi:superoxide reductase
MNKLEHSTGHRHTRQRETILRELGALDTHPTADELHQIVRETMPQISLATVYRNLELLAAQGVIQKLELPGRQRRFDARAALHAHIRCLGCDCVADVDVPVGATPLDEVQKATRYRVLRQRVEFEGLCPDCCAAGDAPADWAAAGEEYGLPDELLCVKKLPKWNPTATVYAAARTKENATMAVELGQIYKCAKCGIIVEVVHAEGGKVVCCGEPMTLLTPNTVDAAKEKHVPVVTAEDGGSKVSVGSVPHPMTEEHYIEFIEVMGPDGKGARQYLRPGQEPAATFCLPAGGLLSRAYCNLHGLWRGEG